MKLEFRKKQIIDKIIDKGELVRGFEIHFFMENIGMENSLNTVKSLVILCVLEN